VDSDSVTGSKNKTALMSSDGLPSTGLKKMLKRGETNLDASKAGRA
jgi:hypothetical protein